MRGKKKVVSALGTGKKSRPASRKPVQIVKKPSASPRKVTAVQMAVIRDLARGEILADIARRYQHYLVPHEPNDKKRLKKARMRLRLWTSSQKFRDLLWEETMIGLDMDSPAIVRGVSRKAQAGRVDAARLAFELNGRHAPHTEVTPAQVNIVFGGIPRPRRSLPQSDEVVDVDAEVEDDGTES